jgi:trehalose-phosphatase
LAADFDWKKTAEPVMQLYTEATDGSYIEHKESAIVWHHHEADPDFGSCQAKELLDHLENVLANEPVVVKRGQHIVEVNPQVSGEPDACLFFLFLLINLFHSCCCSLAVHSVHFFFSGCV